MFTNPIATTHSQDLLLVRSIMVDGDMKLSASMVLLAHMQINNITAEPGSLISHLRLYSSLSRFTLASTLYRARISGVMVSICTPTPSECAQDEDTPGTVVRASLPVSNRRVWL